MNRAYANDLVTRFQAEYPFLKVNTLTGGGGSLLNRVLTESRARAHRFNVFNSRSMTVNTLKKAGAPVDYNFPQPCVPAKSLIPIYMSARPPHPYAAALITDFLMSRKGQEIMLGHGRWVGHKDLATKGQDDIGARKVMIPSAVKRGDRYNELIGWFKKLLLRQGM